MTWAQGLRWTCLWGAVLPPTLTTLLCFLHVLHSCPCLTGLPAKESEQFVNLLARSQLCATGAPFFCRASACGCSRSRFQLLALLVFPLGCRPCPARLLTFSPFFCLLSFSLLSSSEARFCFSFIASDSYCQPPLVNEPTMILLGLFFKKLFKS